MLLSLCIPTYNRAPYLRQLLESITQSIPPGCQDLEIVISDNASTDDTASVILEYQQRLPIHVSRTEATIHAEDNFRRVTKMASGRYLWLFGDDDLLLPRTFTELLPALSSKTADYFVLNFDMMSADGRHCVQRAVMGTKNNRSIVNKDELLGNYGMLLGLISSVIFRRELFQGVTREDFEKYSAPGFSFFYVVMLIASSSASGYCLSQPLFHYRVNNSGHGGGATGWSNFYGPHLRQMSVGLEELGYNQKALARFHRMIVIHYFARKILGDCIHGQPTEPYFKTLTSHYRDVPSAWFLQIFRVIPPVAFRAARAVWRLRHRSERAPRQAS